MSEYEAYEIACRIGCNVRVGGDRYTGNFFVIVDGKKVEMSDRLLYDCNDKDRFEELLRQKLNSVNLGRPKVLA